MIDESQNIYYICYAVLCGLLGIAYLRFQSTQSQHTLVTTKEFKHFQTTFLVGYSTITLCELIANGKKFNLCHNFNKQDVTIISPFKFSHSFIFSYCCFLALIVGANYQALLDNNMQYRYYDNNY
jgi:uncharacterized membrane protein